MRQVTDAPPLAPRRSRVAPAPADRATDGWNTSPAIFTEEFVPDDTGIDAIDALAPEHQEAVIALNDAYAAARTQRDTYEAEDREYSAALSDAAELPPLTPEQERALTLKVLDERVHAARATVIASAQAVMAEVAAEEGAWRQLLEARATIRAEAQAQADAILAKAWAREYRLTRLGVWFTRVSQANPPTFVTGEFVDDEPPPRPREFLVPGTMQAGGGVVGV